MLVELAHVSQLGSAVAHGDEQSLPLVQRVSAGLKSSRKLAQGLSLPVAALQPWDVSSLLGSQFPYLYIGSTVHQGLEEHWLNTDLQHSTNLLSHHSTKET